MDVPYSSSRNSFHLMRFVLATLVILCHSHTLRGVVTPLSGLTDGLMNEGSIAVDGFLVISGFLICQSSVRCRNVLVFLRNRALRILPAFLCALVFSALIVGGLAFDGTIAEYFSLPSNGPFTWMRNWLTLNVEPEQWGIAGVFTANPTTSVNVSLWTVKFEVALYLLMAVLMLLTLNRRRPTYVVFYLFFLLIYVLLSCFGLRLWDVRDTRWWILSYWNYARFAETGLFFFTGTLLYAYRDRLPRRWYLMVIAVLALAVSCWFSFVPQRAQTLQTGQERLLWQLAHVPLKLVYVTAMPYLVIYLAGSPLMSGFARLGDLSFGMYVYSYPIQQLVYLVAPQCPPMVNFAVTLLIVLPLAAWSWRCIELPALRLKLPRNKG